MSGRAQESLTSIRTLSWCQREARTSWVPGMSLGTTRMVARSGPARKARILLRPKSGRRSGLRRRADSIRHAQSGVAAGQKNGMNLGVSTSQATRKRLGLTSGSWTRLLERSEVKLGVMSTAMTCSLSIIGLSPGTARAT